MSVVIKGDSNVNLDFTTGGRITGDFSNATLANRVMFQSTTAGGGTSVAAIPNATGDNSAFNVFANPDPTNTSFGQFRVGAGTGDVRITSGISGTGTYLPMTFYTGGSERVRIDTSGNVGVGATPSAWISSGKAIDIGGFGSVAQTSSGSLASTFNAYQNSAGNWIYKTTNAAAQYQCGLAGLGQHAWYVAPSGTAGNTISFTQAMTLNSGGNLGVGTTTINYRVVADCAGSSSNDNGISVYNDNNSAYGGSYNFEHKVTSGGSVVRAAYISSEGGGGGSFLRFATTNASTLAERIRITSGGDLLVGTTIGLNGSRFYSVTTGNAISGGFKNDTAGYQTIQVWNAAASGTRNLIQFNAGTGGTNVGLVTSDGTNTTYGTSSDYRLKENIQPMIGALEKVAQLKPCIYTWKATGAAGQGFIAHELQNVVPDAVVGEKDAVNEDGSIRPQNIDTSFLVATLTAAIQELKAELDSVKTELALLKGIA